MSRITEVVLPNGGSILSGPLGDMYVEHSTCDNCEREMTLAERYNVWAWAPGSQYWAQVLWFCADCGPSCGGRPMNEQPIDRDDKNTGWTS